MLRPMPLAIGRQSKAFRRPCRNVCVRARTSVEVVSHLQPGRRDVVLQTTFPLRHSDVPGALVNDAD